MRKVSNSRLRKGGMTIDRTLANKVKNQLLLPMKLEAVFYDTYRFHICVYTNECNVVPTFNLVPTWTILSKGQN